MNLTLILGILKEGLKLWNAKESNKYIDQVIKLEKEYYDELSKSEDDRSQLTMDKCLHDIATIAENFVKFASKK
jgi:hypothetical protein